jgi:hypothetical protein
MITGKLYEPDGVTPAVGALVTLWKRNESTKIDSSSQIHPSTAVLQTRTDEEGIYSIVRIGPGMYAIEALDDFKNIVSIDSIFIPNEWTNQYSITDTLKAPGAIRGSYYLDNGQVALFGTYRNAYQISNGSFLISSLSEGLYLLWTQDCQKTQVRVYSGDTTDVKIEKHEQPPVFNNIGIVYDSAKLAVIINWEVTKLDWPVEKAPILGCNLYRRIVGDSSFGSPLNGSELIHDTMFVDTTAFLGSEYQYAVVTVDSAHRIGPISEIVSTSTYDIVVDLDTLIRLIEPGWSRIAHCYFIQSHDPKTIDLAIGPSIVPSWQIQKYDAADGSLISSSLPMLNYTGGWIKTAGDQIFYHKLDTTMFAPSVIVCMDKTGNEKIIETFTWRSFEDFDVRGNTIAIASSTHWNKQDSSANHYSINRSLTIDGMVVYSIIIGPFLSMIGEFRAVRICDDGTFTLFFNDHILKLDASGKEIATIAIPPKRLDCFVYSDTLYMVSSFYLDSNGERISVYSVYDLSNVLLYKVKIKAEKTLEPHLASNGDIYIKTYDELTEKTIIYHLPNPLLNDK